METNFCEFLDNWKKQVIVGTEDELYEAVGALCTEKEWPVGDHDPLGLVADGNYYCLGDPSSTLKEMIEQKTTSHQVVWDDDRASDYERILLDGKVYFVEF